MNRSGKQYKNFAPWGLLLLFMLCAFRTNAHNEYAMLQGRVEKVFDGDTIEVRLENGTRETIRFWGVDAPESYIKRYGYTEFMGNEAKRFTQSLIEGKEVLLKTMRHNDDYLRDKYMRILAFVYRGDNDVSVLLLNKGLARVYRKSKSPRHREFLTLEKEAETQGLGIWNKKAEGEYYRQQYTSNKNRYLILWFWEHDKQFLLKLLQESSSR